MLVLFNPLAESYGPARQGGGRRREYFKALGGISRVRRPEDSKDRE